MAAFHGKDGSVTWDGTGTAQNVLSWSVDASADVVETTAMGGSWKTRVVGFKDWSATVEMEIDDSGLDMVAGLGTSASLTLVYTGTRDLTGTAILTGISPSVSSDGVGTVSLSFTGNGALTDNA